MPEIKTIKLSNPLYIGVIAHLIRDFYDKVLSTSAKKGISYETLYSHCVNVVQNLGPVAELWVSLKDEIPVAWGCWNVLGFPYYGAVYCSALYNNSKDHAITKELAEKFLSFAKDKKAPYVIFETQSEATARICRKVMKELDIAIEPTNITQFIGRI